ncbi:MULTISPECIES: hypothetical protein [unclassified Gordonia (in: high G+C Gram-positive bacteria)]|uniref:hypothetical protein n=1 Tax=unclassified Gordonia (in: high G+C Gram-positive bacteria) TaxID=2657482 RepID=UPI001F10311C|nr:hypothetical protein [Gordonia sp. ABSL49_1]MCH5642611.1 hypothetical protein [Gordonia sp. ABSL49_1]
MTDIATVAGSLSTAVFVLSTLPMLRKAATTRDLSSYSIGNIVLANLGNLLYAIYVVSLPLGPIWVLHAFHGTSTGFMLFWYLRHRDGERGVAPPQDDQRDHPVLVTSTRSGVQKFKEAGVR